MTTSTAPGAVSIPTRNADSANNPEPIKVMTYNIKIAARRDDVNEWIDVRGALVMESVATQQPDLIGFQEAYARRGNENGVTQQAALEEMFAGSEYQFFEMASVADYNMSVIAVNTERFTTLASGTEEIDFEAFLGSDAWQQYFDLHELFHGRNGFVHYLSPIRYLNWVLVEDVVSGERILFTNCHYETFIGENRQGSQYDVEYQEFVQLVNDSFGYASEVTVAFAEQMSAEFEADGVIMVGDFETGDVSLPAQAVFTDAGYTETWWALNTAGSGRRGRRPTMGIDVTFVDEANFTVLDAYYDLAQYTRDASDHNPLITELRLNP